MAVAMLRGLSINHSAALAAPPITVQVGILQYLDNNSEHSAMAKYVMVVPSSAQPGRDDEYNEWYDNRHIHDICALPGVISGKRFAGDAASPNPVPGNYLAIYEIETDDISSILVEMGKRGASGEMPISDALDRSSAKIWFFKAA